MLQHLVTTNYKFKTVQKNKQKSGVFFCKVIANPQKREKRTQQCNILRQLITVREKYIHCFLNSQSSCSGLTLFSGRYIQIRVLSSNNINGFLTPNQNCAEKVQNSNEIFPSDKSSKYVWNPVHSKVKIKL